MTEFERIYQLYFRDVFLYLRSISHDDHVAEELTSETFFKALRGMSGFRGDCDVRVWLCQIAKNCYLTYRKKAARSDSIEDQDALRLEEEAESLEEQIERLDAAERAQAALHNIPEPYKEVFMLRVFAEESFKQIGRLFGKSENWACVTYHRACSMIRKRLEEKNDDERV